MFRPTRLHVQTIDACHSVRVEIDAHGSGCPCSGLKNEESSTCLGCYVYSNNSPKAFAAPRHMKMSIHILLSSFVLTLSGCVIPYPQTSTRFQGVSGHVFDARTHEPIPGVHVAVVKHPSASTTTDADGAYRIKPQKNYHIFYVWLLMDGDSWPWREYWFPDLNFSHPGYRAVCWSGTFNQDTADKVIKNEPRNMGFGELVHTDVLLNPE